MKFAICIYFHNIKFSVLLIKHMNKNINKDNIYIYTKGNM